MKDREPFDRSGGVPGQAPWEREWREYEELHLDRPKQADLLKHKRPMKENQIRHAENLALFTGFHHGIFYDHGIPRGRQRWERR